MAEINVVPYIDVTLVLLLIFMITLPLLEQGIPLQLPKAEALPEGNAPIPKAWVVKVVALDDLRLLLPEKPEQTFVNKEDLRKALQENLSTVSASPTVRLEGTATLDYQAIISVLALLQRLGLNKIQLQTEILASE
jgi:biopolymer transport protein TolR